MDAGVDREGMGRQEEEYWTMWEGAGRDNRKRKCGRERGIEERVVKWIECKE